MTCAAWEALRVRNHFRCPAICLATLMHGNRNASVLVVTGVSGSYATLNFWLREGFVSSAVFNSWDDKEAEGRWWQSPTKGTKKTCYEKAQEVLSHITGLYPTICCGLYAWLLTNLLDSLFAVSFLCVSYWAKGSSCIALYSCKPKGVLIVSDTSVSPCPTNTEARV